MISFDGSPSQWPEFIENFKTRIHLKQTFNDSIRMQRLLSVLKDDAKKSVSSIGTNGIFYAAALKSLKRDFGNPFVVSHMKLKSLFEKPQIKNNDRTSLRQFHQELKCVNTWLLSMGYYSSINSTENLTKLVQRLPYNLRNLFYNHSKEYFNTNQVISIQQFEQWLEHRLKQFFNPIADIIASQEPVKFRDFNKPSTRNNLLNKTGDDNNSDETSKVKCWLCSSDHRMNKCEQFISKSLEEKQKVVELYKLCWNCLSKGHIIKNCNSEVRCRMRGCGKKHHTLIHQPDKSETPPSARTHNIKSITSKTYLQIVPVTISNGINSLQTNAVLDTGSDSSLIRQDIAKS